MAKRLVAGATVDVEVDGCTATVSITLNAGETLGDVSLTATPSGGGDPEFIALEAGSGSGSTEVFTGDLDGMSGDYDFEATAEVSKSDLGTLDGVTLNCMEEGEPEA